VEPSDFDAIEKNPNTRLAFWEDFGAIYISLNQKDPVLSNPKVSEALRYLIDYEALENSVMRKLGRTRQTFVLSSAFGAIPAQERPFRLDLDKAKQLLAEAGYAGGFKKELTTQNIFPYPDIAQHIQSNAKKVGIDLGVRTIAGSQLFGLTRSRGHEISLLGYGFNYPDANNMFLRHVYNPDNCDEAKNTISIA